MEAGATGPPNHTKAAPQLFGGDAGLPEGPDFRAEPPDWELTLASKAKLLFEDCKEKKNGVPKIHLHRLLFSSLN